MKKVRFLDLSIKNSREKKRLKTIFSKSLDEGVFVLGKPVENFEKKISNILNLKYSIGISSGTSAVYLALKAIGIKPGDEVIVPCMSWYSTFTSVVMNKAIPIGVDIDEDLLMNLNNIKSKVTKKTKAILYVHFTGYVKDLTNLSKYCKSKNIFLIEYCEQSLSPQILLISLFSPAFILFFIFSKADSAKAKLLIENVRKNIMYTIFFILSLFFLLIFIILFSFLN